MGLTCPEELVLWRSSLNCLSHIRPCEKPSQKKEAPLALFTFWFNFRTGLLLKIFTKKELAIFFKCHNSVPLLSATQLCGKQCPANNIVLVFRGDDCQFQQRYHFHISILTEKCLSLCRRSTVLIPSMSENIQHAWLSHALLGLLKLQIIWKKIWTGAYHGEMCSGQKKNRKLTRRNNKNYRR